MIFIYILLSLVSVNFNYVNSLPTSAKKSSNAKVATSPINNSNRLQYLITDCGLSPKILCKLKRKHPHLYSGLIATNSNIRNSSRDILINYGLDKKEIQRLYTRSVTNNIKHSKYFEALAEDLITEASELNDSSFQFDVLINRLVLRQSVQLLEFYGVDIQKVLKKQPRIIFSSKETLQESIQFLELMLNFTDEETRKLLKTPSFLLYTTEHYFWIINFFIQEVGCSKADIRKMILKFPNLLGCSVTALVETMSILSEELDLNSQKDLVRIIGAFPNVCSLSRPNLERKMFLYKDLMNMSKLELQSVVLTMPQTLSISEANLRSKVDYFVKQQNISLDHLRDLVLYQPSLLSYSLEGRIKPRMKILKEKQIDFLYAPPYLMSLTEERFKSWLREQERTWTTLLE